MLRVMRFQVAVLAAALIFLPVSPFVFLPDTFSASVASSAAVGDSLPPGDVPIQLGFLGFIGKAFKGIGKGVGKLFGKGKAKKSGFQKGLSEIGLAAASAGAAAALPHVTRLAGRGAEEQQASLSESRENLQPSIGQTLKNLFTSPVGLLVAAGVGVLGYMAFKKKKGAV